MNAYDYGAGVFVFLGFSVLLLTLAAKAASSLESSLTFGLVSGSNPFDAEVIPLGGQYFIKSNDLLFIVAGLAAIFLSLKSEHPAAWSVLGILLLLIAVSGIAVGWY